MCVAYPGKALSVTEKTAEVDFGGNIISVRIGLVDVKPGDYVLVHAGIAIEVMDEEKARGVFEAWAQVNAAQSGEE